MAPTSGSLRLAAQDWNWFDLRAERPDLGAVSPIPGDLDYLALKQQVLAHRKPA
ncbi:MAG: hypothetical protein ACRDTX_31655 [Pseudonocardiaceae bacterium]